MATIELVVVLPVLFAVVFLALQAALYHYGRTAALAAAETGARAAATETGTTAACRAAAEQFLGSLGDVLTNTSVDCTRTATTVTVVVRGEPLSVVAGWRSPITQSATLPVERLT